MPTQIETTNATAIHARLETLSEQFAKLADALYRNYPVDLPEFHFVGLDTSHDWFRLGVSFYPISSVEIQCNTLTGESAGTNSSMQRGILSLANALSTSTASRIGNG